MKSSSLTNTQLSIGGTSSIGNIYIKEEIGTEGDFSGGTITLAHNINNSNRRKEVNSIVFQSATHAGKYGIIKYQDDEGNQGNGFGRLRIFTIGINSQVEIMPDVSLNAGCCTIGRTTPARDTLDVGGIIRTQSGFRCGDGSGNFNNVFNISWEPYGLPVYAAYLYIDNIKIGVFINNSDYRIKRNIETQQNEALSRIMKIRPITYMPADYGSLFKSNDNILEGFIAHELAEVIPSAVVGEKDAPDQIQSLRLDALCSVLTKGIQELIQQNQKQQLQIDELQKQVAHLINLNANKSCSDVTPEQFQFRSTVQSPTSNIFFIDIILYYLLDIFTF